MREEVPKVKTHSWNIIIWAIIVVQFIAYEFFALLNSTDTHEPFTFYVRKIVGHWTSPVWFLALGFIVWMAVHFLFVHK